MTADAPRLLIVETSGRAGQVAVARGADLLGVRPLSEARRNARDLAPAVAALLAEQGWAPRDLHAVVVGLGPGSYTGLRVGVMSAKALAYATGCALVGVETFAAVALQAPAEVARLDVLADAQQDKVYAQPYVREAGRWAAAAPLAVVRFADWLAARDPGASVTGPGLARWGAQLPAGVAAVEPGRREPTAAGLLALGLERYRAGQRDDVFGLGPMYLRPSSAEEQWRGR